jgi:hypothetical protein
MAAALSAGDPGLAQATAGKLAFGSPDVPGSLMRPVNALAALAAYEHNPAATLDSAAAAFDATERGDPYRVLAATLLAEHAVAAGQAGIVRARAEVLNEIADEAAWDEAGRLADARLRACVADRAGPFGEGELSAPGRCAPAGTPRQAPGANPGPAGRDRPVQRRDREGNRGRRVR